MLVRPQEEFDGLYLLKQGEINCFDKNYNYLHSLENGSFFGEYNIMFGLYSSAYY